MPGYMKARLCEWPQMQTGTKTEQKLMKVDCPRQMFARFLRMSPICKSQFEKFPSWQKN